MIDFVHLMLEQRRLFNQLETTADQYRAARQRAQIDPVFAATELDAILDRLHQEVQRVHTEADAIIAELSDHV